MVSIIFYIFKIKHKFQLFVEQRVMNHVMP